MVKPDILFNAGGRTREPLHIAIPRTPSPRAPLTKTLRQPHLSLDFLPPQLHLCLQPHHHPREHPIRFQNTTISIAERQQPHVMALVRDPAFWRRFSMAVHLDEEAQLQKEQTPELKHSYVSHIEPLSPSTQDDASLLAAGVRSETQSRTTPSPVPSIFKKTVIIQSTPADPASHPASPAHTPAQAQPPKRKPSVLTKASPRKPGRVYRGLGSRNGNSSVLTLGLSGRPNSRFNFWTSISADPSHRESWLEEQRRKKSKRTCMCWGFWLGFLLFVAAIVVAILLLKKFGII